MRLKRIYYMTALNRCLWGREASEIVGISERVGEVNVLGDVPRRRDQSAASAQ
jgi:hypothetical protein